MHLPQVHTDLQHTRKPSQIRMMMVPRLLLRYTGMVDGTLPRKEMKNRTTIPSEGERSHLDSIPLGAVTTIPLPQELLLGPFLPSYACQLRIRRKSVEFQIIVTSLFPRAGLPSISLLLRQHPELVLPHRLVRSLHYLCGHPTLENDDDGLGMSLQVIDIGRTMQNTSAQANCSGHALRIHPLLLDPIGAL